MHRYVKYTSCSLASGDFLNWCDIQQQSDCQSKGLITPAFSHITHLYFRSSFNPKAFFLNSPFFYCFCPNILATNTFYHSEALQPRLKFPYGFLNNNTIILIIFETRLFKMWEVPLPLSHFDVSGDSIRSTEVTVWISSIELNSSTTGQKRRVKFTSKWKQKHKKKNKKTVNQKLATLTARHFGMRWWCLHGQRVYMEGNKL